MLHTIFTSPKYGIEIRLFGICLVQEMFIIMTHEKNPVSSTKQLILNKSIRIIAKHGN